MEHGLRPPLMLDERDVRAALGWDDLIQAMRTALAAFSQGNVQQPVRQILTVEERRRYLGVMPAVEAEAMGVKIVSFYPGNAGTAYPTHMAMVLLFETRTGRPSAVLDGRLITEMRTAAVSAAATDSLAPARTAVLALLGSGVQAEAHLHALQAVRKFEEVRVWSRTAEHAARFGETFGVRVARTAEEAVRGADVVVTATSAQEPVLCGRWLKDGAHVNAVGACLPTWRELDDDAMAQCVIVDSREAAAQESGDVILSKAAIYAELGEIFAGTKPKPVSRTTIFKSLGLAIEDIAAAKLALARHEAMRASP